MTMHFAHRPISIGLLLFPTVEELDFAGPYEVFANAGEEQEQAYCQVLTIGTAHEIRCRGGLRVLCDFLLEDSPRLDVLIVPGGPNARNCYNDERIAQTLRTYQAQGTIIASVCTGSFYLAYAGLLDQRRATTHPLRFDLFRQCFPQIELVEEKIIDEGNIVTAGGVSSGIDLALHFLQQWFGPEARKRAAKRLDGPWI
ncbi:DJ-1/PfpI family protein [Tengunoibacter tsumagoiensis]|uniref:AraC family transcriptional regulator n=1 Tax=Tengunoibacter tsumagoiensis TaxID=2014871 RepID=A0A402A6J9_9CHLR|nr:DJ-1/PfpI family protein [Tengunoibacter tsumagoiensis]GCE14762.1 AraC family transcriptional regulator [Tengunoibacter tsumagoiensis]